MSLIAGQGRHSSSNRHAACLDHARAHNLLAVKTIGAPLAPYAEGEKKWPLKLTPRVCGETSCGSHSSERWAVRGPHSGRKLWGGRNSSMAWLGQL